MISLMQVGRRVPLLAVAFLATSIVFDRRAGADDCVCPNPGQAAPGGKVCPVHGCGQAAQGGGTLGYGPPGVYPGFQGFGLGYHLGYGYGGAGLGVGAEGGYPFYGGPGYPHCPPPLRRCGRIQPFAYYGGPGYPTPENPNFFGAVGPLAPSEPVVKVIGSEGVYDAYGGFTGVVPYPESYFATFTAAAAATGTIGGASTPPAYTPPSGTAPDAAPSPPPPATTTPASGTTPEQPGQGANLGIEEEPVVEAGGVRALKIAKVHPQTAAEKAGLHAGDVIHSTNGYLIEHPGNLAWIISHASPNKVLVMNVRAGGDAKDHTVTVPLR